MIPTTDMVAFWLIWASYLAWLALFVVPAWRGKGRPLLVAGTMMVLTFAAMCLWIRGWTDGGLAAGMLLLLAAAILVVPPILAAIVYPIGRCWSR